MMSYEDLLISKENEAGPMFVSGTDDHELHVRMHAAQSWKPSMAAHIALHLMMWAKDKGLGRSLASIKDMVDAQRRLE